MHTCNTQMNWGADTAKRERQQIIQHKICCIMLPRRSFCGYGIIHTVWFLLRRYWPIPAANCNSPTHAHTQYAHSDHNIFFSTANMLHMKPQDINTCCMSHPCKDTHMHEFLHAYIHTYSYNRLLKVCIQMEVVRKMD